MRVAVIAGGDPGHVFPAAALTQALTRRGHQAVLCTGAAWLAALERDGIPAIAMAKPPPNPEPDGVRRLRQTSRRLAPQIAQSLADFAPTLVVADVMTPAGGLVAGLLDVPWLQLVPHPLQDPSRYLPPSGSGMALARGPLGRLRDERFYRITAPQWQQGERDRERDRERLGLSPDGAAPLARLIASLPALEGLRPDWPLDTYLVGPLEWDPADVDLTPPAGDGPLVLLSATTVSGATVSGATRIGPTVSGATVSGATTSGAATSGAAVSGAAVSGAAVSGAAAARIGATGAALAEATLAGLAGTGIRLAWTVLTAPTEALPDWVAAGPGRQAPLIDQAAAVICGGGHGILAKALGRGRPVVTVPGGGEQRENADRVHRAGLGIELLPTKLNPQRLARAVHRVIDDPGFAAAAAACRPVAGARSSGDRAVDVIERVNDK